MSSHRPQHPGRSPCTARLLVLGLLLLLSAGCGRPFYRRQADQQSYGLIGCATRDPRWPLKDYTIQPSPASRFFDPNDPDRPPMPPDDPTSHLLMHCVDCKRGFCCWHRHGDTPCMENPAWRACLPYVEDGAAVLNRQTALQLALINSREYQFALEAVYLSALDVTFQRFRLDAQFFGGNSTFFTTAGPLHSGGRKSQLEVDDTLQMQRLLAGGGELVVGAANSLVWQFAGPDTFQTNTLLNFSLLQPLLRAGGRAVVLENLTQSERALLANVRQMEFFRHGFYVQTIAGRPPIPAPARGGINLNNIGPTTQGATGGILALLSDQVRIRNQKANVAGLRDSVDQIEANYDAGRIDRLQLDQARQALFSAQRSLLSLETGHDDRLDAYKITLGMPPQLNVHIDDPLLAPLVLIHPKLNAASDAASELVERLRAAQPGGTKAQHLAAAALLAQQSAEVLELVRNDLRLLGEVLPARCEELRQLALREEVRNGDVDLRAVDVTKLNERVEKIGADFARLEEQLRAIQRKFETFRYDKEQPGLDTATVDQQFLDELAEALKWRETARPGEKEDEKKDTEEKTLADVLLELSLVEARVRVETVRLVPVDLDPAEALQTARGNRLDWMNARAALVDQWRQIRVQANALRSDLNILITGDINTTDNNPLRFRSSTGQLRAGVQFDPPLTRLAERNAYREALIEYQRARRAYYAFEDRVDQDLRSILRSIRQAQLDFELRRVGVHVAVTQVDITRLRLKAPPKSGTIAKPGEAAPPPAFGPTAARDLTGAYSGLLTAQNDFLAGWVDYEVDRLNLDLSLGTMQLDSRGAWIDPGPIQSGPSPATPRWEEVPPPEPELPPPQQGN
jgi:outer membrane protein TolC